MKSVMKNFMLLIFILSSVCVVAQKQINQYDIVATYERGVLLFENKHYNAALECFEQYIKEFAGDNQQELAMAKYYEAVSSLYLGNGNCENKIMTFINENPTNLMVDHAKFLYANHLFKKKKYRNALNIYNDADIKNLNQEEQIECKYKLAYCYYQTQNIEEATPLFNELSQTKSSFQNDSKYYYAHIQYINNNREVSYEIFKDLKKTDKYKDISEMYIMQYDYENGNYDEVTKKGDIILNNSQKNNKSDIALMIAESWFQLGEYDKSLEYYDVARKNTRRQFPKEVEFNIGFCKMKNQNFEDAIGHFEDVANDDSELGQYASYYMAQCYTNLGQDKFARNTFLKAYNLQYNDTLSENALFNYAALSFIPGIDPFNEAVTLMKNYIKDNPDSERINEAQDIVVHLFLNNNDYDNALETIEQYSKLSPELEDIQSRLTYNLGIQYYNEGDWDNSITFLNKSIKNKNGSNNNDAIFWIADAYFQKKDLSKAQREYQRFVKEPSASKTDVYALAYYNMGYIAMSNGNFNEASQRFKEFINNDKTSDKTRLGDSWMRIGDCYFIQRQYNDAITSYSNATKLSSSNIDYALYQQAMGYGALGKTNEKISCLNIITTRYNKSSFYDKALYEIGVSYQNTNDNRSAISAYDRVVKERPRSSYARKALMRAGMIYYNNDQNDKALEKLKLVVSQYPNTDESREALNLIGNIYRDVNDIQSYFNYIKDNNLAEISIDEQDSLTFRTVENFYSLRKYNETIKGAKQYLEKYPGGAYLLDIHYFAMKSMENTQNIEGIKTHIEYIINQPDNDYTDNALLLMARIDYDSSYYNTASDYYERLIGITENNEVLVEAVEGCMKSYYFSKQYENAIERADQLIKIKDITDNQKKQANYILGKSYFDIRNYTEALKYFDFCSKADATEVGAESSYLYALCQYKMNKFDEAEEAVFYVSDNFNTYIDWTARSFILLSDVYVAKNNMFQAKETLKSVIDNYPEDGKDATLIIGEAQEKLNVLNKEGNE